MRVRREQYDHVPIKIGTQYVGDPIIDDWVIMSEEYSNEYPSYSSVVKDETHPGPPYNSGGPFFLCRQSLNGQVVKGKGTYYGYPPFTALKYVGGFTCSSSGLSLFANPELPSSMDPNNLADLGAEAWSRFSPNRPSIDLAVSIGELKDLPRMLKTSASFFRRKWKSDLSGLSPGAKKEAANHWLNHQFGWLPFISDIRKFVNTYNNLEKKMRALKRNNGQWVKRTGTFSKNISEVVKEEGPAGSSGLNPDLNLYYHRDIWKNKYRIKDKLTSDIWFSGRFKFYIPELDTPDWKRTARNRIFGLRLTPSSVWELMPWSWLIDWFSNTGNIIQNITNSTDNLVAKYAYLMEHRVRSYVMECHADLLNGPLNLSWDFTRESKTRVAASPYGFDLSWDNFSLRQASILAALGISRF